MRFNVKHVIKIRRSQYRQLLLFQDVWLITSPASFAAGTLISQGLWGWLGTVCCDFCSLMLNDGISTWEELRSTQPWNRRKAIYSWNGSQNTQVSFLPVLLDGVCVLGEVGWIRHHAEWHASVRLLYLNRSEAHSSPVAYLFLSENVGNALGFLSIFLWKQTDYIILYFWTRHDQQPTLSQGTIVNWAEKMFTKPQMILFFLYCSRGNVMNSTTQMLHPSVQDMSGCSVCCFFNKTLTLPKFILSDWILAIFLIVLFVYK